MSVKHEYMSRPITLGLLSALLVFLAFSMPVQAQAQVIYVNPDRNIEDGQKAMSEGDYARASRYFKKAVRRNLSSEHMAIVQNSLCASLFFEGAYEDAEGACSAAIEEDGRYWKAYVNRGHARKALGDQAGALADFCKANTLSPGHVSGAFQSQCEG
ncbi:MAG: hypothetical protein HWE08_09675 [Alphaproteobacteria bacterium]|nr:hypothetical protein [Alphaproteobacteria bacterium]